MLRRLQSEVCRIPIVPSCLLTKTTDLNRCYKTHLRVGKGIESQSNSAFSTHQFYPMSSQGACWRGRPGWAQPHAEAPNHSNVRPRRKCIVYPRRIGCLLCFLVKPSLLLPQASRPLNDVLRRERCKPGLGPESHCCLATHASLAIWRLDFANSCHVVRVANCRPDFLWISLFLVLAGVLVDSRTSGLLDWTNSK